ncbi:MAG TPA: Maf family protein [Victivallales bacterium]|nr:Maf family protein [Victivallales bacterium]HPO89572.1 Maf family protein [Victivallales bacterium]HRR27904.1 Maf family protein [Victivallales bacterium]HRU00908.1 Maf family protein [Victivallales bacterium]
MITDIQNQSKFRVILASGSLRRAELLRSAGIDFEVIVPKINEILLPDENPVGFCLRLAREKAESIKTNGIIIAADTIVMLESRIFGKPSDMEDAVNTLRLLSGKTHNVITGVCLRFPNKIISFHVSTSVEFRNLSEQEIRSYVETGEAFDKAGAYAIQGRAASMIRRINGSYTNVVGLPLCEIIEELKKFYEEFSKSPAF